MIAFEICTSAPPTHRVKSDNNGFFVVSALGQLFGGAFGPFLNTDMIRLWIFLLLPSFVQDDTK